MPFPHMFEGMPAVMPSYPEWMRHFQNGRRGDTGVVEFMYTAPVGTKAWVLYGVHYLTNPAAPPRVEWRCLARVTDSQLLRRGTRELTQLHRTTLVLIGDPVVSP